MPSLPTNFSHLHLLLTALSPTCAGTCACTEMFFCNPAGTASPLPVQYGNVPQSATICCSWRNEQPVSGFAVHIDQPNRTYPYTTSLRSYPDLLRLCVPAFRTSACFWLCLALLVHILRCTFPTQPAPTRGWTAQPVPPVEQRGGQ